MPSRNFSTFISSVFFLSLWSLWAELLMFLIWFCSVDATRETGRMGRLINHSKNGNCQTKLHDINGVPHLILVASRNIEAGEELLYDYGDRSKASIAAHPWLKYWWRASSKQNKKRKGKLTVTVTFLFNSCTNAFETECVPFCCSIEETGRWGGELLTFWGHMTSVLFIYVFMRPSGCFAARLFCTFCIRAKLLQHAGGS